MVDKASSSEAAFVRGLVTSLAVLLPAARSLSRTENLRLIRVLAADLAESDDCARLESEANYPVWSPFDAHQAAAVLLGVLDTEMARP